MYQPTWIDWIDKKMCDTETISSGNEQEFLFIEVEQKRRFGLKKYFYFTVIFLTVNISAFSDVENGIQIAFKKQWLNPRIKIDSL